MYIIDVCKSRQTGNTKNRILTGPPIALKSVRNVGKTNANKSIKIVLVITYNNISRLLFPLLKRRLKISSMYTLIRAATTIMKANYINFVTKCYFDYE